MNSMCMAQRSLWKMNNSFPRQIDRMPSRYVTFRECSFLEGQTQNSNNNDCTHLIYCMWANDSWSRVLHLLRYNCFFHPSFFLVRSWVNMQRQQMQVHGVQMNTPALNSQSGNAILLQLHFDLLQQKQYWWQQLNYTFFEIRSSK